MVFEMNNAYTRAAELTDIMESLSGVNNLMGGGRKRPYPELRSMIWIVMRDEGYSFCEIGEAFGRHYATVVNMEKKWREITRTRNPGWREFLRIWDRFKEAVESTKNKPAKKERLTALTLQSFLSYVPPTAVVVFIQDGDEGLNYDRRLNTVFIKTEG